MGRPAGSVDRRYLGVTPAGRVLLRIRKQKTTTLVNGDCWLWQGALTGESQRQAGGYGLIKLPGSHVPKFVHRVVYEELVGPVPAGLELDHLCAVKRCVNPNHLEAVTHAENVRRGISRVNNAGVKTA